MGILPASEHTPPPQHTHPGPPIFIALSPFFLLVWGFVATDSGSETNGFWFLGPEILPDKVVDGKYTAQSWALGGRRGRGGGGGEPLSSAWSLFTAGTFPSYPRI